MAATRRALIVASTLTLLPGAAFAGDDLTVLGRRLAGLLDSPQAAHRVAAASTWKVSTGSAGVARRWH